MPELYLNETYVYKGTDYHRIPGVGLADLEIYNAFLTKKQAQEYSRKLNVYLISFAKNIISTSKLSTKDYSISRVKMPIADEVWNLRNKLYQEEESYYLISKADQNVRVYSSTIKIELDNLLPFNKELYLYLNYRNLQNQIISQEEAIDMIKHNKRYTLTGKKHRIYKVADENARLNSIIKLYLAPNFNLDKILSYKK